MLAYRQYGQGNAVLLIHGFGLNGAMWEAQVEALASNYLVLVPDLPGHGETPPLGGDRPITIERYAEEVLTLLDALGVDSAAVVGHSMGGYVTMALQKIAPKRVTGVAMISSQARADTPDGKAGRLALAEKVAAGGSAVLADAIAPKLFAASVDQENPDYQRAVAAMRQMPVPGIRDSLLAMAGREATNQQLAALRLPTLFLAGADDRLIPPDRTEEMAGLVTGGEPILVGAAGHMVPVEQPALVTKALRAWLAQVYPG
jgi:3-oxoadipate enol-lactonase